MEKFSVLFDKSVFTITAIVVLILVISLLSVFFVFKKSNNKTIVIIAYVLIFLPLVITSFFIPTSYSTSTKNIVIHKVLGKISINNADINEIFVIHPQDLKRMYRTFACGGFGGYFGKYSSPKYGTLYVYAGTLSQNLVMIQLKDSTLYLITPKEMDKFIENSEISYQTGNSHD